MTTRSSHAPFPPPPDIEPTDTAGVVTFREHALGRITAHIGHNMVGYIEPHVSMRMRRAAFRCTLDDGQRLGRADTMDKARVALLHAVADWHDAAGQAYAALAHAIRMQAEEASP
jgi:hypothetical protein